MIAGGTAIISANGQEFIVVSLVSSARRAWWRRALIRIATGLLRWAGATRGAS